MKDAHEKIYEKSWKDGLLRIGVIKYWGWGVSSRDGKGGLQIPNC